MSVQRLPMSVQRLPMSVQRLPMSDVRAPMSDPRACALGAPAPQVRDPGLTRRSVLRGGAVGLLALGGVPIFVRTASGQSAARREPLLVVVFLRGGADGLALLAPQGDHALERARPAIMTRGGPLLGDLDGREFALHPAWSPLEPWVRRNRIAAAHAVGWPAPVRSHFDAQDLCERAGARASAPVAGWLARALAATVAPGNQPRAFRAFSATPRLPVSLAGDGKALAIEDVAQLRLPTRSPAARTALIRLFSDGADDPPPAAYFAGAGRELLDALEQIRGVGDRRLPNENAFPQGDAGRRLATVARMVRADLGVTAAWVDVQGWDTHVRQGADEGTLARAVGDLARAIAAFGDAVEERSQDLLMLVVTEFGRTVRPNGSGGTDHGRAGAAFLLGGALPASGVVGRWPGVARADLEDGRDLRVTTDIRDVLALGARHLGVAERGFARPERGLARPERGLARPERGRVDPGPDDLDDVFPGHRVAAIG